MKLQMMKSIYIFVFLITIISACTKVSVPEGTPRAIKKLIDKEQKNCLNTVTSFTIKEETVYYFDNGYGGCADMFNDLYSENGELICHPSGGFSGGGDGKCDDKYKNLKDGVVIWERQ